MTRSKSDDLRTRMGLISGLLNATASAIFKGPNLARLVRAHLVLLHQITRASVPLMATASEHAKRAHNDEVCMCLAAYLERHIEEEMHHDEWTLQDLNSIGIASAHVLASTPLASVAALVGAQYYWVLHHHPIALLGYIAMLESNAPPMTLIEQWQAQTGLPESAFRTLRLHATIDPEHQDSLYSVIDSLPLTYSQERLIGMSAMHTGAKLVDCLTDLQRGEVYWED
jgi:hypothetical protein